LCRGGRWNRGVSRNRCGGALLLATWRPWRISMAFAAVTASTSATPSRLAFALIGRCGLGCRTACRIGLTLLPRLGPFRMRAILPFGTLATLRPLISRLAIGTRIAFRTFLALRPLAARLLALLAPRALLGAALAAVAKAVAVAIMASRPVRLHIAAWRAGRGFRTGRGNRDIALEPAEQTIE
jgi:hypothetical protein